MPSVTVFAPAKINLYLHVTGRRADGYHLLDSLVAFADIGDRVTIRAAREFSFNLTGAMARSLAQESPDNNLVVRAAKALAAATGRKLACAITLEKNLPPASGIGGGSSDAAAALRALAEFWQLPPHHARPGGHPEPQAQTPQQAALDNGLRWQGDDALQAIARDLGQDVPSCLYRKSCYFRGIGDEIDPAPELPQTAILLVNPGVHLPTPDVFKARTGEFSAAARLAEAPKNLADLVRALDQRRNDLYEPAARLAPVIGECLNNVAAAEHCLLARMSGSGATCFGLFADLAQAESARDAITAHHPGWWAAAGMIPHSPPP